MSKTVEVLLTDNVLKLGVMGDVVKVRAGYARNYLLPYGMAIPANAAAKRQVEVLRQRARQQEVENEAAAKSLAKQIDGSKIEVAAKVSHDTHLFGSVGIREIVASLKEKGFAIDNRQVNLHENIKELGNYSIELELFKSVKASIKLAVVDSDPQGKSLQDTLAEAQTADAAEPA